MKMLKKSVVSLIAAAAVATFTTLPASAVTMSKSMERDLIGICAAIKSDNKLRLNSKLKQARLNYQDISDGLVCNGMSVQDFARAHNATQTGTLIAARSRSSDATLTAQASR